MDAKDRLRRYLEQRRELGESELVLDSLSIDDVMKMVGAKSSAPKGADAPSQPVAKSRAQTPADRDADAPPPQIGHAPVLRKGTGRHAHGDLGRTALQHKSLVGQAAGLQVDGVFIGARHDVDAAVQ